MDSSIGNFTLSDILYYSGYRRNRSGMCRGYSAIMSAENYSPMRSSVIGIGREFIRRVGMLLLVAFTFVATGALVWLVKEPSVSASVFALLFSAALYLWTARHWEGVELRSLLSHRSRDRFVEMDELYATVHQLHNELLVITSLAPRSRARVEIRMNLKNLETVRREAFRTMAATSVLLVELEGGGKMIATPSVSTAKQWRETAITLERMRGLMIEMPNPKQEASVNTAAVQLIQAKISLQKASGVQSRSQWLHTLVIAVCACIAVMLQVNDLPWQGYLVVATFGLIASTCITLFERAQIKLD